MVVGHELGVEKQKSNPPDTQDLRICTHIYIQDQSWCQSVSKVESQKRHATRIIQSDSWIHACLSASNMFPIWQLGHDVIPSNGSTSYKQLFSRPSGWWLDMNIDVQIQCEKAISMSCRTVQIRYKFTDYLIDVESMTQLNLQTGSLRRIRRLVLRELPWSVKRQQFRADSVFLHIVPVTCLTCLTWSDASLMSSIWFVCVMPQAHRVVHTV